MTKLYTYSRTLFCVVFFSSLSVYAQENNNESTLKNLVSTNLMLPIFESFDISFERTITGKLAVGLAGAMYGNGSQGLNLTDPYGDYKTNYEIMPYARIYFQGAQKASHFLELLSSWSEFEKLENVIRSTNTQGYGVYSNGAITDTSVGVGIGTGYRFLFFKKHLLLEAQFGIRTNLDKAFNTYNDAIVRTGIKVGYRF